MTEETQPPSQHAGRERLLGILTTVLLLAWTARLCYVAPFRASDLRITPDEVEYAICAQRVATLGRYDLEFDGQSVAPHSTPWFSCLLAPAYLVGSGDLGNGIWVVFAFGLLGVFVLQRIGKHAGGPLAGALVPTAVLAAGMYSRHVRLILTDVPASVIALTALLFHLRLRERVPHARDYLIAGALAAAAFALRSVYLSLLLPSAWLILARRERRIASFVALLAPLAVLLTLNAIYQHTTFGDRRRTGYQFWCAVPYDYPDLMISTDYVGRNLRDLWLGLGPPHFLLGAAGLALLALRRVVRAKPVLAFAALTALPIAVLHLLYFYADLRFHVYLLVLLSGVGGLGAASLLPQRWRSAGRWLAPIAIVIAWVSVPSFPRREPPRRRLIAEQIFAKTPRDAVVISSIEPVYLAALAPADSERTFVTATRGVEFASKVLVDRPIPREIANPRDAFDHRAPGLIAGGAREAVKRTAPEMQGQLAQWVREGKAVFFETRYFMDPETAAAILGPALALERPEPGLTRVVASPAGSR